MECLKQTPPMELAVATATTSYQDFLEAQKDLFESQIEKLQNLVSIQCKLTGVNPLSQEMAAGALSIKIGKRPRDLMNPKALKYMQSVFSIKDAINKRDTREISAQFGVTLTQVRDFFTGQRSRVRKFVRLSREKAERTSGLDAMHDGVASISDPNMPGEPLPLNTIAPLNTEEGPSCSKSHELLSGTDELDRHFIDNIFSKMRKEETFSGQVKLIQWILRMGNSAVLKWFLSEGGVMILVTWLSQAAAEEQTSVLHAILQVLSYLPLREALPAHMSAVLQSVNRLRFYRSPDISHRSRILLSKWSKMFEKSQSLKRSRGVKSESDAQAEMLLKQSIDEVMCNDPWDQKDENFEPPKLLCDNPDNYKKSDSSQPLKLLAAAGDDSSKRRGVLPTQTRERRKVQMVEHPSQRSVTRSPQVAKPMPSVQSRPLSADDIQKAKMRAQFKQSKNGKASAASDDRLKPESQNICSTSSQAQATVLPSVSKSCTQTEPVKKVESDNVLEPPPKKHKRVEIPWRTPPELQITDAWQVGTGTDSKEVEVQRNRIRREREVIYRTIHEIPSDPRDPWDREMDYDDTLTPKIPIDQLPDVEPLETTQPVSANGIQENLATASTSSGSNNMPEPDLELLAELLKNPELVFALTSGKAGDLSSDDTVKLLDMIKANRVMSNLGGKAHVEVSLPSPTPSSDVGPNGQRPDFSRNPFSRQPAMGNGGPYQVSSAVLSNGPRESVQTTTFFQPQNQANMILSGQPSASGPHSGHLASPSRQTSIQLPEQWQQMPANPSAHHQSNQPNSFNVQHLTPEMMLSANNVPNSNRAPTNALGVAKPATRVEPSLGNFKMSPPVSNIMSQARLSAPPPHISYAQEPRQGVESVYQYQNNPTLNNFNAYAGGSLNQVGHRGSRNNHVERPEFESWSPDNSPSRHHEYIPGRRHQGPRVDSRHGYGREWATRQNPGYQDHGMRGAGSKRWRDHRR